MGSPLVQRVPRGHERTGAGLIVPTGTLRRKRQVLTRARYRLLERCITDVLEPYEIKFSLVCNVSGCPSPQIMRLPMDGGSILLRCGCRDREIHRDI